MAKHGIHTQINDERFGIPSARLPDPARHSSRSRRPPGRSSATAGPTAPSGRSPSPRPSALRATAAASAALHAAVQHRASRRSSLRRHRRGDRPGPGRASSSSFSSTDLAHEVITARSFSSTNPIHAFSSTRAERVREYARWSAASTSICATGEAQHKIVDRGTCHQTANLNLGPGTDRRRRLRPALRAPVQHDGFEALKTHFRCKHVLFRARARSETPGVMHTTHASRTVCASPQFDLSRVRRCSLRVCRAGRSAGASRRRLSPPTRACTRMGWVTVS